MTDIDLDALPDATLVLDPELRLVAVNDAATQLLGPGARDHLGEVVGEAFVVRGPGGAPRLRDHLPEEGV